MANRTTYLTIGDTAKRCGLSTATLRFYEERGLISSIRTTGNQRRYERAMLRRISVIRAAQTLGLSLEEIAAALAELPDKRTPTKRDWEKLSKKWRAHLDERIYRLQQVRDNLTRCIGCGCLSLKRCSLYNNGDHAAQLGAGPQFLYKD